MLKKILAAALWLPLMALAQSYPSPTYQNLTVLGTFTSTGNIGLSSLATQAANTVVANATASNASPTAIAVPSCSTSSSALNWTTSGGSSALTCNTAINAATLGGSTFASPGPIGSTTASSGAFTTISASTGITATAGITSYKGVSTVANGVPSEYAQINSTAQTASIASATLYAVPSGGSGFYLVFVDLICTTTGTGGTVQASLGWNNGSASMTANSSINSLSTLGNEVTQIFTVYSAASQNITYSTTVSGASGSPQYSVRIRLFYLG